MLDHEIQKIKTKIRDEVRQEALKTLGCWVQRDGKIARSKAVAVAAVMVQEMDDQQCIQINGIEDFSSVTYLDYLCERLVGPQKTFGKAGAAFMGILFGSAVGLVVSDVIGKLQDHFLKKNKKDSNLDDASRRSAAFYGSSKDAGMSSFDKNFGFEVRAGHSEENAALADINRESVRGHASENPCVTRKGAHHSSHVSAPIFSRIGVAGLMGAVMTTIAASECGRRHVYSEDFICSICEDEKRPMASKENLQYVKKVKIRVTYSLWIHEDKDGNLQLSLGNRPIKFDQPIIHDVLFARVRGISMQQQKRWEAYVNQARRAKRTLSERYLNTEANEHPLIAQSINVLNDVIDRVNYSQELAYESRDGGLSFQEDMIVHQLEQVLEREVQAPLSTSAIERFLHVDFNKLKRLEENELPLILLVGRAGVGKTTLAAAMGGYKTVPDDRLAKIGDLSCNRGFQLDVFDRDADGRLLEFNWLESSECYDENGLVLEDSSFIIQAIQGVKDFGMRGVVMVVSPEDLSSARSSNEGLRPFCTLLNEMLAHVSCNGKNLIFVVNTPGQNREDREQLRMRVSHVIRDLKRYNNLEISKWQHISLELDEHFKHDQSLVSRFDRDFLDEKTHEGKLSVLRKYGIRSGLAQDLMRSDYAHLVNNRILARGLALLKCDENIVFGDVLNTETHKEIKEKLRQLPDFNYKSINNRIRKGLNPFGKQLVEYLQEEFRNLKSKMDRLEEVKIALRNLSETDSDGFMKSMLHRGNNLSKRAIGLREKSEFYLEEVLHAKLGLIGGNKSFWSRCPSFFLESYSQSAVTRVDLSKEATMNDGQVYHLVRSDDLIDHFKIRGNVALYQAESFSSVMKEAAAGGEVARVYGLRAQHPDQVSDFEVYKNELFDLIRCSVFFIEEFDWLAKESVEQFSSAYNDRNNILDRWQKIASLLDAEQGLHLQNPVIVKSFLLNIGDFLNDLKNFIEKYSNMLSGEKNLMRLGDALKSRNLQEVMQKQKAVLEQEERDLKKEILQLQSSCDRYKDVVLCLHRWLGNSEGQSPVSDLIDLIGQLELRSKSYFSNALATSSMKIATCDSLQTAFYVGGGLSAFAALFALPLLNGFSQHIKQNRQPPPPAFSRFLQPWKRPLGALLEESAKVRHPEHRPLRLTSLTCPPIGVKKQNTVIGSLTNNAIKIPLFLRRMVK